MVGDLYSRALVRGVVVVSREEEAGGQGKMEEAGVLKVGVGGRKEALFMWERHPPNGLEGLLCHCQVGRGQLCHCQVGLRPSSHFI